MALVIGQPPPKKVVANNTSQSHFLLYATTFRPAGVVQSGALVEVGERVQHQCLGQARSSEVRQMK